MSVIQIGGTPECVCGSRWLGIQIKRLRSNWIDYEVMCALCGAVMLYREPDTASEGVTRD